MALPHVLEILLYAVGIGPCDYGSRQFNRIMAAFSGALTGLGIRVSRSDIDIVLADTGNVTCPNVPPPPSPSPPVGCALSAAPQPIHRRKVCAVTCVACFDEYEAVRT